MREICPCGWIGGCPFPRAMKCGLQTIKFYHLESGVWYIIPSEARFLLGLESFHMASWPIFRVRLNFLSYCLRRLRPRRHMLLSRKLWAPSKWSCKAYKLYGSAGLCLPGKSIFARPKMIAPSWPKVVRPVADGKDVARCGLSIGLFLAPLFHD